MSRAAYLKAGAAGVELAVKVTPGARRAALGGTVHDAAGAAWLAVSVTEPAEAGRATRAALRLIAARCDVAASAVALVSGGGSRWKRLRIAGDAAEIAARLGEAG